MLRLGESVPSRRAHLRLSAAASEKGENKRTGEGGGRHKHTKVHTHTDENGEISSAERHFAAESPWASPAPYLLTNRVSRSMWGIPFTAGEWGDGKGSGGRG